MLVEGADGVGNRDPDLHGPGELQVQRPRGEGKRTRGRTCGLGRWSKVRGRERLETQAVAS